MAYAALRPLKRIFTKKCGGVRKSFLLLASVGVILYTIKSLLKSDDTFVWDISTTSLNKSTEEPRDVCDVPCLPGQISFYISSGEKTIEGGSSPVICFNGQMVMNSELQNVGRGLNVALIDSVLKTVKATHVFDTYVDDSQLLMFLKKEAKESDIVFLTSYDDASTGLKITGRKWLKLYGSALIEKLNFRDNFIMIGHRALETGKALEFHAPYVKKKNKKDSVDTWAPIIQKAGCFSFPMGNLVDMKDKLMTVLVADKIKMGPFVANCGMSKQCPAHSAAVSVDTGESNVRKPRICVKDNVLLGSEANEAGRGLNLVVLDKDTLRPNRVAHMDTYSSDSTDLELLIETMEDGEIIIASIADDGSRKLTQSTRNSLNQVGSSQIQNLRFRDVWYFIGQKGIQGFTLMEQISFAGIDGAWPKPLAGKYCVPKELPFSDIMIEPDFKRNDRRRDFCLKYEGYTDFCDPSKVDEELVAIPVSDIQLKGHTIYKTPVIIVPGMNHNAFVHTLETTLMQPGILPDLVTVLWDEKLPEYGELAALFGFRNYSLDSSPSYPEQLGKALQFARLLHPSADHLIVLEEDLLMSPDFLPFMAACLNVMEQDASLVGAFGWNINGFDHTSGNPNVVYRVQDFPGLGFLMTSDVIERLVKSYSTCCQSRAWRGWLMLTADQEMLMPDVSRVYRTPFYGAQALSDDARSMFLQPRRTNLELDVVPLNLAILASREYEDFLHGQVLSAHVVKASLVAPCVLGTASPPDMAEISEGAVVIFYKQESIEDYHLLVGLCRCFGLVTLGQLRPNNMHNGMVRFHTQHKDVFLVGSLSPYFSPMISSDNILTNGHLREKSYGDPAGRHDLAGHNELEVNREKAGHADPEDVAQSKRMVGQQLAKFEHGPKLQSRQVNQSMGHQGTSGRANAKVGDGVVHMGAVGEDEMEDNTHRTLHEDMERHNENGRA